MMLLSLERTKMLSDPEHTILKVQMSFISSHIINHRYVKPTLHEHDDNFFFQSFHNNTTKLEVKVTENGQNRLEANLTGDLFPQFPSGCP
jgi:hypothetical protein